MKTMTNETVVELMRRYEHADRQTDSWKNVRDDAYKGLEAYVSCKYASVVTRKLRDLCKKHVVSEDRHWWLSHSEVHPSVDHSVSPWSVSARVTARVGLYIHTDEEVARDELEIGFNVEEMDVALNRLDRMMSAGVNKRIKA